MTTDKATDVTAPQALEPVACHFCASETCATTLHAAGLCWAQVECLNDDCSATGPCRDTEAEAIAAWNHRTASEQPASGEDMAQRLQDHMEQHHGVCLKASEWDAVVAALSTTSEAPAQEDQQ